jgi:outer membrane protein
LAVKQRETAEKQFENKVINEINLLDYKQKEKLAEINYNSAKSNLELAYKSLENLLGITLPRIPVKIDIKYDEIKDKPEDLLNKLYANNLSIKNASLDLEKSKLNLDKAYLPSWEITFSGGYNTGNTSYNASFNTKNYLLSFNTDQTFGDTISSNKESWSIKVQFSIPILDGGSSNINKTQAELSLKQMQINFEKTKKDVELNFWKTYYNLIQAQATIKQKEVTLEQKKMNLKSYEIEYMQAKYDLEDAILNYNLLRVQLNNLIEN